MVCSGVLVGLFCVYFYFLYSYVCYMFCLRMFVIEKCNWSIVKGEMSLKDECVCAIAANRQSCC